MNTNAQRGHWYVVEGLHTKGKAAAVTLAHVYAERYEREVPVYRRTDWMKAMGESRRWSPRLPQRPVYVAECPEVAE